MIGDIVPAWRTLRRSPGFALAAVCTMAIGIGAVTGIFSVVNAALLRPLPVPDADRVVALATAHRDQPSALHTVSLTELADWQRQSRTIAAFGAWRDWGVTRHDTAPPEPLFAAIATPGLFEVLGVRPAVGRLFNRDEDTPGRNRVVLLGHGFWRERFGARTDAVGSTMVLSRGPNTEATYTIVGVLPPEFDLPSFDGVQLWALSSTDPDAGLGRRLRNRNVLARLRDGVAFDAVRSEMSVIADRLARQYPETNRGWTISAVPLLEWEVGAHGPALRAFLLAVGFVLLIACANVATLLLARALSRRREFAIRQALGGGRSSVVRVLLAESLLLSIGGGILGLSLAGWLVRVLLALGPQIPRAETVPFQAGVFAFALAVCALSAILLALPASLLTTKVDLATGLKEESAQVTHGPALRFRSVIVAAQVALALVLVAGALVAAQTMTRLLTLPLGFDPRGLTMVSVFPPSGRYARGPQVAALYERLIDETRHVAGVTAASAVSGGPLFGGPEPVTFTVEGRVADAAARPTARYFNAAPGYFRAMGLSLRGRDFNERDTPGADAVTVVNETFARRFLTGRDPIGARLRLDPDGDPITVIGVVRDVLQDVGARATPVPEMYWPYTQAPRWATFLVFRSNSGAAAARAVIARVRAVDRDLQIGTPLMMEQQLERSLRTPQFTLLLLSLFAGTSLLLSAIGIYGLVSYSISNRRREIGVRVSLGASSRDVLRAIGKGGLAAVLAGSLAGLAGTIAVARVLAALLPDLEPLRFPEVAFAWALMVGVGVMACYIPARRAMRIDPAVVLRSQ
jgi:putative ABC transport system permease protein